MTVRGVCSNCNNGWMSDLEVGVKPLLLPWIDGERTRLAFDQQQAIATWAVKTTLMLQYTPMSRAGIVIPANQYYELIRSHQQRVVVSRSLRRSPRKSTASQSWRAFLATGDQINALGVDAAFAVAAGKTATLTAFSGQWHALLNA